MKHNEGTIGMRVYFGRGKGQKTLGEIVKINPKKFKVKTLEHRGRSNRNKVGDVWNVPASLCTIVSGDAVPPTTTVIDVTDMLRDALVNNKPDLSGTMNTTPPEMFALADIQNAVDIIIGDGGYRGDEVVKLLKIMRERGEIQ
jgi:hypothetical protein